jgi:hypothetical protein
MINTRILLSATWVVVTLLYLYGDVFRICSGDLAKNPMADMNLSQVHLVGDRGFDVDSHSDGFPEPGITPTCESLGEYCRGRFLFSVQPGWSSYLCFVI